VDRGPDARIDAVGLEALTAWVLKVLYDQTKLAKVGNGSPHVLRANDGGLSQRRHFDHGRVYGGFVECRRSLNKGLIAMDKCGQWSEVYNMLLELVLNGKL